MGLLCYVWVSAHRSNPHGNTDSTFSLSRLISILSPTPQKNIVSSMATRIVPRYIPRRLYSGGSGKVLSEEEKAAENVYIKRKEQEKLEKLARKGPNPDETPVADAKPTVDTSSSPKVSSDKNKNYVVVAGIATFAAAVGWYVSSRNKQPEQVKD